MVLQSGALTAQSRLLEVQGKGIQIKVVGNKDNEAG
jgi:hypothetical protein